MHDALVLLVFNELLDSSVVEIWNNIPQEGHVPHCKLDSKASKRLPSFVKTLALK